MNRFDEIISRHLHDDGALDGAAADRVLATLRTPLPAQRHSIFEHWPSVLLDLDFAPAWPRLAALACVMLVGCMAGLFGPGAELIQRPDTAMIVANAKAGAFAFEPDPLTGVRP
jgi:hypothetical protein